MRGQISATPVHELLITVESSAKSGAVRLISEAGEGTVWFRDGMLVDAQLGDLVGEDAVCRLLGVTAGRFEVEYTPVARPLTIGSSVHHIFAHHAARRQSWRELLGRAPSLNAVLVPVDGFAALRPEAELIALFDGRRCMLDVIESSGRDPVEALRTITALFGEGVLVEHSLLSERPHSSGSIAEIAGPARLPSGEGAARDSADPRDGSDEASSSRYSVRPASVEVVEAVHAPAPPRSSGRDVR